MILTAFINIAYSMISWIVDILPVSEGWGTEAHTAMTSLGNMVGMFTGVLPMDTIATCIAIVFGIEVSIFIFKTVKWIVSHIPFIGGSK